MGQCLEYILQGKGEGGGEGRRGGGAEERRDERAVGGGGGRTGDKTKVNFFL